MNVRVGVSGFSSVEDLGLVLGLVLGLPAATVDQMRDMAIFVPG